ncbi:methionyl-tRNA formyltransferase [Leptolyngbya sp. FACHB-261]|nr:methionyl-tRNA formyltransferase [Leptolyngbya sp. FACHB-261]
MRVVFFGTPEFAVPTLEHLLSQPQFEVLAVVTQPDKRRGRGSQLTPSPVKVLAQAHNLPIWQPRSVKKDDETLAKLADTQADAFVVVAYGQILSQQILDMPRLGCVNVHGSLLPKYRGAAPIQWAIYNGETETGITTMRMEAGLDTGPMLLKANTPIPPLAKSTDLAKILSVQGATLLLETLLQLAAGTLQATPQDDAQATYAPLLKKEHFALDWSRSASQLHNQVRAFTPNCFANHRSEGLKVTSTLLPELLPEPLPELLEASIPHSDRPRPGEVLGTIKRVGPAVATGDGVLLLSEVQPAGKRAQSGWDYANGCRLQPGERFENGAAEVIHSL